MYVRSGLALRHGVMVDDTIEKVTTVMGGEMESEYERCIYEC